MPGGASNTSKVPYIKKGEWGLEKVLQLKIVLNGIKPVVWRRIHIEAVKTFWDLHFAIQSVMGWRDIHFHFFEIYVAGSKISISESDAGVGYLDWDVRLDEFLCAQGRQVFYTYDFDSDWQHVITLEKILPKDTKIKYPICISGRRACPPEDVGGVEEYKDFLKYNRVCLHPEYKTVLQLEGDTFDPKHFNVADVVFADSKKRFERG